MPRPRRLEVNEMNPIDGIQVDDSLWPLTIVRFLGVPTTQHVEVYLSRMTSLLERGERHVTFYDSTGMTGMGPAEQRHMQAAWLKRHDAQLRELRLGAAYAVQSAVVRLAVGVVFYLKPPASPYLITSRVDEAIDWTAKRLREDGQEIAARRVREHFGLLSGQRTG
jgi:hypothetical protein